MAPAPPRRPLAELVAPVLKVAIRQAGSTPVRHPILEECFVVVRPTEPASTLFEQALAAIAHIAPAKKDSRHEMEDMWGDGE